MKILIAEEKHGTRYFDASTDEALHAAALKLLRERAEDIVEYDKPEGVRLTDGEIAALPTLSIQVQATKDRRRYDLDLRDYNKQHAHVVAVKKALKARDGALAWEILLERSDCEYERVDIETLESPDDED